MIRPNIDKIEDLEFAIHTIRARIESIIKSENKQQSLTTVQYGLLVDMKDYLDGCYANHMAILELKNNEH